jgi:uncharacterized membrane protein YbaN (DUF454 family)
LLERIREYAGSVLIVIGVIGILTPILPGTIFFVAGVALLGSDHPRVRPWMDRLERWRKAIPQRVIRVG